MLSAGSGRVPATQFVKNLVGGNQIVALGLGGQLADLLDALLTHELEILQNTQAIAHDLAGIVVAAALDLLVDECLETLTKGEAAGHRSLLDL